MTELPAVRHLIGGTLVADGGGDAVFDPATGRELLRAPRAPLARLEEAIQAAARAYEDWRRTTPGERARMLLMLADAIELDAERFARIESLDVGKPIAAARAELEEIVDALRFLAAAGRSLPSVAAAEYRSGHTSMLRREPLGVVGLMTPWNYPLMVAVWKLGAALSAGNCAVLKPSEVTPLSAALLAELAAEILPPGVLNVVFGRGAEVGAALAGHPDVAMVSLTGGTATGRAVAGAAARTLQRVTLELGGNAPVVVLADADLDAVCETVTATGFANAGQDCTAAARVIAEAPIADELAERLGRAAGALRVGSPADEETQMGPLVSDAQRDRVAALVDASGGTVRTGGKAPAGGGWFYAPTVVSDLGDDAPIVAGEVFGPVVTVQSVPDTRAAIAAAGAPREALAASVWGTDGARALAVAAELRCGVVWVNDHMVFASELPHSGRGDSGYGADLSLDAVLSFTQSKHVMVRLADLDTD